MATVKVISNTIRLPDEVMEALDLKDGDELIVTVDEDEIILRRETEAVLDSEQFAALRAAVAEGFDDYRAGRVTPTFHDMDAFEAYRQTDAYRTLIESE